MPPPDEDESHTSGGIRFGADASNAYAGEVGYDAGPAAYDTEIVDDEEEEEEDQGRMQASHPSTLQRRMVRYFRIVVNAAVLNSSAFSIKRQVLIHCCFVVFNELNNALGVYFHV